MLGTAPPLPFYLVVVAAAALQNIIPLPAFDLIVLFAAFLASAGRSSPAGVFLAAWLGNAGVAAVVYVLSRKYRLQFLASRVGKLVTRGSDVESAVASQRWGVGAVFISSFLPVRPLLPVLGGIANIPFRKIGIPIAAAAGCWYALIVLIGMQGGKKFEVVIRTFRTYSGILVIITIAATTLYVIWWLLQRNRGRSA